jgi:hypothetical protein
LSDDILRQAAIFYIDVLFEESLRKNRRRFNPDRPDSVLEHGLPDEKLIRLYQEVDWAQVSGLDPETIRIRDFSVPYAVFPNDDDVTTSLGPVFEARHNLPAERGWSDSTGAQCEIPPKKFDPIGLASDRSLRYTEMREKPLKSDLHFYISRSV